jgi:RNA polymerase sigma factor (sigma-70 family)
MDEQHATVGLEVLVDEARRGDPGAWGRLIDRFDPLVRHQARAHGWLATDLDDVSQETWTNIYANLATLREPTRLAGWIKVVATNAARRRHRGRWAVTVDEPTEPTGEAEQTEAEAIVDMTGQAVRRAVEALPARDRALVTLLTDEKPYAEISATLEIPVGSIGPTRQRILARLRGEPELRAWAPAV